MTEPRVETQRASDGYALHVAVWPAAEALRGRVVGLHGVQSHGGRVRIAWAFFTNRGRRFPIPLSDPALFTANPEGQQFIAADLLGLRTATAGLLAASTFIDRRVKRVLPRVKQPVLLMLSGQDRIVDNARTLAGFERLASREKRVIEYPEAHPTLEFEPHPSRYARAPATRRDWN